MTPLMPQRRFLLFTFGLSMFSSLLYEVAWMRHLSLTFGTTVYSMSAVLTSFMAGLALGAYIFGRIADRCKRPLRLFGNLQFLLAGYALLLLPLFNIIRYPYVWLHHQFGGSILITLVLFVLAFLLLIIPTGIIGAAFTLMSKLYAENVGKDVSEVYAVDTLFGGMGAFMAGFLFLPHFGLLLTTIIAALINVCVGYTCTRRDTL